MSEEPQSAASKWADIVKPFVPYILAVLGLGGVGIYGHQDAKTVSHDVSHHVLWDEAGDHFQDLVQTNNLWQTEIEDLRAQVAKLQHCTN
jgi:hypothetical protein